MVVSIGWLQIFTQEMVGNNQMQISEFTLGQPHPQETPQRIQPTCLSCLSKNLPSPLLKEWKQQKKTSVMSMLWVKHTSSKKLYLSLCLVIIGINNPSQPLQRSRCLLRRKTQAPCLAWALKGKKAPRFEWKNRVGVWGGGYALED